MNQLYKITNVFLNPSFGQCIWGLPLWQSVALASLAKAAIPVLRAWNSGMMPFLGFSWFEHVWPTGTKETQSWNFYEFLSGSHFYHFCYFVLNVAHSLATSCYILLLVVESPSPNIPNPMLSFCKGLSEFKSVMRGQPVIPLLSHHSNHSTYCKSK